MRKVKIHWPNGSARIEDYDNQVQRGNSYRGRRIALVQVGFYLAELSCWFFGRLCRAELSWCSADCWVDSDATREEAGSWWWADQQVATSERVTDVPCVLHLAQPVIKRPTIWDRAAIWERKHVQSDSFWVKVVVLTKKSNIGCLLNCRKIHVQNFLQAIEREVNESVTSEEVFLQCQGQCLGRRPGLRSVTVTWERKLSEKNPQKNPGYQGTWRD